MCGYLRIQKPQYIIQGHSGGESWSAQFERTTHDSIACITVARAKSLQHCAKLVEQKLFEKIYSSEIQLGDGDAKFPDPAMDYERHRQYFAQLKAKERKRREADEGLTLEEIGRRAEGQGEISLPPSANSVPLGISRRSLVRDHSLDEETGYDSGDQLHPSKMILEDVDELICEARGCDPSDLIESGPAGHSGSPLNTSTFEQRRRNASKQPRPSENSEANNHTHEAAPSTNIWPPWDQVSPRPAREPRLLPSGELPYVSPPPFLDTPVQSRPLSVQAGAGAAVVKVEPAQIEKAVAVKIEGVEEEEAIVVEREPREGNLEEGEIEG